MTLNISFVYITYGERDCVDPSHYSNDESTNQAKSLTGVYAKTNPRKRIKTFLLAVIYEDVSGSPSVMNITYCSLTI